jgi:glycosyltransferase involved in cell wall biosynthesis
MSQCSVAICAHNPKPEFIARTLAALRNQDLPKELWELVVIDNASELPLARTLDLSWHPNGRIISEPALGLTHARLRAIRETAAPIIVFVDDDNILSPTYLRDALDLAAEFPRLGSFGGQCLPEFVDAEPPAWTRAYWECLAIWEFDRDFWANVEDGRCVPCGAGLVVRREVALAYADICRTDERRRSLDRRGTSLMSAGDYDLALCACDLNLGTGKFSRLTLQHLMPAGRFEESYLIRLWRAVHCSGKVMRFLRKGYAPRFTKSAKQKLFRLGKLALGAKQDVHYRFALAAEQGLRDADALIDAMKRS